LNWTYKVGYDWPMNFCNYKVSLRYFCTTFKKWKYTEVVSHNLGLGLLQEILHVFVSKLLIFVNNIFIVTNALGTKQSIKKLICSFYFFANSLGTCHASFKWFWLDVYNIWAIIGFQLYLKLCWPILYNAIQSCTMNSNHNDLKTRLRTFSLFF